MSEIVKSLAAKVEKAIMKHKAFKGRYEINVFEEGKVVRMRGKVPSKKYLQSAEKIALGVAGVAGVVNQIEIDPSLAEQPGLFDLDDETQVPPARSGPHAQM